MSILQSLLGLLFGTAGQSSVSSHHKRQAIGPHWSQHRRRRIDGYSRSRSRSFRPFRLGHRRWRR
jgi:hypothetical protein